VLITGGSLANARLEAAPEVWDPTTQTFTDGHGPSGADVPAGLVIGDDRVARLDGGTVSVWHPGFPDFRSAATLITPRDGGATMTLLQDGQVLVVGGTDPESGDPLAEAEIWDPETGTSSLAATPLDAHADHVAALLPDGRVLVAGGTGAASRTAELFEPR
jgi:hypothetical protein